jgi:hypothetical protein
MSEKMVERVARALCGRTPDKKMYWFGGKVGKLYRNWETSVPEARAAIAAMREPTEGMLKISNVDQALQELVEDNLEIAETKKEIWQAMIDEALK